MKWIAPIVAIWALTLPGFAVDTKPAPAKSIDELREQLEKILKDTHTPGVSVAIVHRDGPEWVAGLGKADVASGRAATPETLFRIGSVSKGFASLAILMLVDRGKLSLDDPVRKLAPEVWFENPWETTDPVRVVHLLEHTTGWEDMRLREAAKDTPGTVGLREALDYDHHSRISRWRPGTRMSYSNSGPPVAAYIVEKLTHQRFEHFVEENLFRPIGLKTATYFQPAPESTATLYHDDGTTPYRYWNLIFRPAGSINASAQDMAAYLQFYLSRGKAGSIQVVPSADIDRMEIPTSTWAAREGMKTGYGLSNYWSVEDGFVYHGHNGGLQGGVADMGYMPGYGVGYFYSLNTGNGDAVEQVGQAIRAYVTRNLQRPPLPAAAPLPPNAADYAGWYQLDSPRDEMTNFLQRLAIISLVRFKDGKLLLTMAGAWNDAFVPVADSKFRSAPTDEAPQPVATLALLAPNEDGRFFELGMGTTMKRIPAWSAIVTIVLTAFVLLSIVSILVYAPFWLLGGLSRNRRRPAERGMRIWPLVAVLSLIVAGVISNLGTIDSLGNLTAVSAGLCAATILFAVSAIASAVALWRGRSQAVRRYVYRFSIAVTAALLIASAYLAYWGMIGVRTWA